MIWVPLPGGMTPVMYSIFFLEGLLAASLLEVPGVRWPRSWLIELACFLYQIPQGRHEPNLSFLAELEPNDRTLVHGNTRADDGRNAIIVQTNTTRASGSCKSQA